MMRILDCRRRRRAVRGAATGRESRHSQQALHSSRHRIRARGGSGICSRLLSGVLVGALLSGSAGVAAQSATATSSSPEPVNAFPAEAEKLGVRQCANLFSALGQAVAHGSTYAVLTQADDSTPDAHAVQGVVGMRYDGAGNGGQAAGIVMATPVGKDCEGQMVRVAPFQQPCNEVVGLLPPGSAAAGELSGVPLYDLGGNQGLTLMLPSGPTCVVVTVTRATDVR